MPATRLAKLVMRAFERHPHFSEDDVGESSEVFNHDTFLRGSDSTRQSIMLKSSENKYKSEMSYPWDNYFGVDLSPFLLGKVALDLGCFTGGRSAAWFERYKLQHITGIDVSEVFIAAARQFASVRVIRADFRVGFGESLPFESETFDAILSFDVLEHVQSLEKTLDECRRVLRTGGSMFLVFPGYFHPIEHHLALVTRAPCVHWFFSGQTLVKAYSEILEERGEEAYWYKRESPDLAEWERGNTINGTTLQQFKALVKGAGWRAVRPYGRPIGSVGRSVSGNRLVGTVSRLFSPLTRVPGLQEIFLHRITYVLEK
ncbi:MAG: methyltransferase domain-containing protein [Candidatus Eisenbacteria bacterium]